MANATFEDDTSDYKGHTIRIVRRQNSPTTFEFEVYVAKAGQAEARLKLPVDQVDNPQLAIDFGRQLAYAQIDKR